MSYQTYQNGEADESGLNQKNIQEESQKSNFGLVKVGAVIGAAALTGLVIFSATSSKTSSSSSSSAPASSQLISSLPKKSVVDTSLTQLTSFSKLTDSEAKTLFDAHATKFGRQYKDDAEKETRFGHFKDFLKDVDERNEAEFKAGGSAKHGITKFADMSKEEFTKSSLGYSASRSHSHSHTKTEDLSFTTSSTSQDWTDIYTTAVKDQGYCGSCWAFSATEQIESDSIRLGILTTSDSLSPQQIVSCDTVDLGCDGGNVETAYLYVNHAGGIESDADYPYTSYWDVTGTCSVDSSDFEVTVTEYYAITKSRTLTKEEVMEEYVLTTGTLAICLSALTWSSYTGGIVSSCPTVVDHCVQATGVNLDEGYWKVRNSWGTDWGDAGYIYLATGKNICDITYDPTYTKTASV